MSFRTFDYSNVRQISIDHFGSGSITIEPGTLEDTVEGSLNATDEAFLSAIEVRQDRDHLRIEMPNRPFRGSSAHLRLSVPPELSYDISSGSADISITADVGRAKITSGSGDVHLPGAGDLECGTGSGDIAVGRLHGGSARLTTGSGDVVIDEAHGPVHAKSGSGDLLIRSLLSDLRANSGSGDISVPSTLGSVDLRSASGSITVGVADDLPAWLDLNSVSGDIRITIEPSGEPAPGEPFVSVRARTASGEIAVYRA
jgi:DUF4097 and DUF4098 domain-containing protein YvlB